MVTQFGQKHQMHGHHKLHKLQSAIFVSVRQPPAWNGNQTTWNGNQCLEWAPGLQLAYCCFRLTRFGRAVLERDLSLKTDTL